MNKLKRYYSKLKFKNPPKTDVLIFDSGSADYIKLAILNTTPHETLNTRKEDFYISFSILFKILNNLKFLKNFQKNEFYKIYLLACIQTIRPKVIITFVDNNILFQQISIVYKQSKFYAIQNGIKCENYLTSISDSPYGLLPPSGNPGSQIFHKNLFCYGEYEKDLFIKMNHKIENFIPVGPFVSSYYLDKISPISTSIIYDICLISQWLDIENPDATDQRVFFEMNSLCKHLAAYKAKHKIRLTIAGRYEGGDEEFFFKNHFSNEYAYIPNKRKNFSTYKTMEQSEVVLGYHSAACFEAFSWGKKVLFCNFGSFKNEGHPSSGPWLAEGSDYLNFEKKLSSLIKMPSMEFRSLSESERNYRFSIQKDKPAYLQIRELIFKDLT